MTPDESAKWYMAQPVMNTKRLFKAGQGKEAWYSYDFSTLEIRIMKELEDQEQYRKVWEHFRQQVQLVGSG